MPNKATPTNPIILYYSDKDSPVPSMKNEHEIHYHEGKPTGIGRSRNVKIFLKKAGGVFETQFKRQEIEFLYYPKMVGAFVHLGVFISPRSKTGLPSQDVDNMYTSVQETWQNIVLHDDVQIVHYSVGRFPVASEAQEFVLAFLWELDKEKVQTDPKYPIDMSMDFYNNFYKDKSFIQLIGAIK